MDTQYLTREKHLELQKELEHLKQEKRKEIAEHLEYAKKLGDLSENAEYHQAREEQAILEDRISHLENLLKQAVITKAVGNEIVTIGSTVGLQKDSDTNKSMLCTIVGSEEADMSQGKISNISPLGAALLGHRAGETVSVSTPKGVIKYKIEIIK